MNERYQSPADLFNDDSFRRWVLSPTPGLDARWTTWLDTHPEQAENTEQAKVLVRAMKESFSPFSQAEADRELSRLLRRIDGAIPTESAPRFFKPKAKWAMAAALAFAMLAGYWWKVTDEPGQQLSYEQVVEQAERAVLETSNTTNHSLLVTLPDGSSVVLAAGAKISFPNRFTARRREVYLSGRAFFEVSKNPRQPFFVYANEMIIKVLGTSFSIDAAQGSPKIEVLVKTGKVAVFSQKDSDKDWKIASTDLPGLVLLPQQRAVLDRRTNRLEVPALVPESPFSSLPIQGQEFNFRKTPVAEVLTVLEGAYGLHFVFDEKTWEGCTLTSELGDEPLVEKMKIICTALDARCEITDREVIVRGTGCR